MTCPSDPPRLEWIIGEMERLGHTVFCDRRGYDLNIVGVRSTDDIDSSRFNDWMTVSYLSRGGQWCSYAFPATTDPGLHYRSNPMNNYGTAIMLPGQYRGSYQLGTHNGYAALRQVAPIRFARDSNRDTHLDIDAAHFSGVIKANIHRAGANDVATRVGRWSAGCQVVADPSHFEFLISLCRRSAGIYGDLFSYSLLERGVTS